MTPSLDYLGHIRPPTSLSSFLVLLGSFVRDIVHYPRGEEMRAKLGERGKLERGVHELTNPRDRITAAG